MQTLSNEKNILLQGSGCVWSCVHLYQLQQAAAGCEKQVLGGVSVAAH